MQHDAVHALCLLESEFNVAGGHTVWGCPVSVPRVVGKSLCCELSATLAADTSLHASHEVVAEFALYDVVISDGVGRVDRMDESVAVDGEVEQEGSVVSYAAVV